jgi:hypothetical protein
VALPALRFEWGSGRGGNGNHGEFRAVGELRRSSRGVNKANFAWTCAEASLFHNDSEVAPA